LAAALSRLTFSKGVSPAGPVFFGVDELDWTLGRKDRGGFAEACGVVDVKRVASAADRDIVASNRCSGQNKYG